MNRDVHEFQLVAAPRTAILRGLDWAMEGLVLALVCLSPWAFGAVHPLFASLLLSGIALVVCLWAMRMLVKWRFSWRPCSVSVCLAAVVALGCWQLAVLPPSGLRLVSPATARLAERLQPRQAERLAVGEPRDVAAMPAGRSISLFPSATRDAVIQLLSVFLLFAAVRNSFASPASLRRLCLVALINGTLLAYFGIVQFFSSDRNVLYWTYPSLGTAFGPFINRNHFAFYVNICIGLGLGLLLSLRATTSASLSSRSVWESLLAIFRDSRVLATSVALATMIAAVVMCVSRGGVVALLAGSAVCLIFKMSMSGRQQLNRGLEVGLLVALLAGALLIWLGFDLFASRLATLWEGDALREEGRVKVWKDTLFALWDFPVWGTGYGTFAQIEPLYRSTAYAIETEWGYAHNEYQQVLVEGGTVRALLTVLGMGLLVGYLGRAYRGGGRAEQGMTMGVVFALAAVAVHSFVENGLQIPAISCLAAVVCAHVCDLGDRRERKLGRAAVRNAATKNTREVQLRLRGLAPLLGATCLVCLAVLLHVAGRRADLAERFRLAALRWEAQEAFDRQIAQLEAAVRVTPENALLHADLAAAHFRFVEVNPDGSPAAPGDPHLVATQRHYLLARDLCFLLPRPQVWLAANAESLAAGDTAADYLRRAIIVRPFDPRITYVQGLRALHEDQLADALHSWRKCLQLSPLYLDQILDRIAAQPNSLAPQDLLDRLLPDDPRQLLAAAQRAYPERTDPGRRLILERALEIIRGGGNLSAEDHRLAGTIHQALGQPAEAVAAYELAVLQEPREVAIRYEFASLHREQAEYEEAARELRIILALEPNHRAARQLLETVIRESVRGTRGTP